MKLLFPALTLIPGFLLTSAAQDSYQETALIPTETEESFIPTYSFAGAYGLYVGETDFDTQESGDFSYNEASIWLDAPLYLGHKLKWTLGIRYRYNGLDAGGETSQLIGSDLDLHRLQLSTNLWYDASDRWNFWSRISPGLLSDFSNISGDDIGVNALALGLYKFNDQWRGAIGGFFTTDLGEAILLPAIGIIWTPNQQWSLSLTVPRLQIAYAPNRDWLLTLNALPGGGGWNIENPIESEDDLTLNYSAIRVSAAIERKLGGSQSRLWAFVEGGFHVAQSLEVQNDNEIVLFDEDIDSAFFGAIGVKLRF